MQPKSYNLLIRHSHLGLCIVTAKQSCDTIHHDTFFRWWLYISKYCKELCILILGLRYDAYHDTQCRRICSFMALITKNHTQTLYFSPVCFFWNNLVFTLRFTTIKTAGTIIYTELNRKLIRVHVSLTELQVSRFSNIYRFITIYHDLNNTVSRYIAVQSWVSI